MKDKESAIMTLLWIAVALIVVCSVVDFFGIVPLNIMGNVLWISGNLMNILVSIGLFTVIYLTYKVKNRKKKRFEE